MLLAAAVSLSLGVGRDAAWAGHSESYMVPGMPYDGSWGYRTAGCGGSSGYDSTTVPSAHHRPGGGHFGVDYYGCPGTIGRFYAWNWGSGNGYGLVGEKKGSCADTQVWRGHHYRIDLYNGEGNRADYRTLHVDDVGFADGYFWGAFGNPPYQLYQNQAIYWGTLIGWTKQYAWNTCYQVNNARGTHWHLELANDSSVGHYACFYSRPAATQMWASDYLGIGGANVMTVNTACP